MTNCSCEHGNCNHTLLRLFKKNRRLRKRASKQQLKRAGKICVPWCQTGNMFRRDASTEYWEDGVLAPWALINRLGPRKSGDRRKICCCLRRQNKILQASARPRPPPPCPPCAPCTWGQEETLAAPSGATSDFGDDGSATMSASGDVMAVGDNDANNTGKVAVTRRSGGTWSAPVWVSEEPPLTGQKVLYGSGVSLTADGTFLAVGCSRWGGSLEGAVALLRASGPDVWKTVTGSWLPSPQPPKSYLGSSVAIAPEGGLIAAGAVYTTDLQSTGSVAVYEEGGGGWASEWLVYEPEPPETTLPGKSVSVPRGAKFVVAGMPGRKQYEGGVVVFSRSAAGWEPGRLLAVPTSPSPLLLGWSVSVSADGLTIVAGAPDRSVFSGSGPGGVAYYDALPNGSFDGSHLEWLDASALGLVNGDEFGGSVSVSCDGLLLVAGSLSGMAAFRRSARGKAWGAGQWISGSRFDGRPSVCLAAHCGEYAGFTGYDGQEASAVTVPCLASTARSRNLIQ